MHRDVTASSHGLSILRLWDPFQSPLILFGPKKILSVFIVINRIDNILMIEKVQAQNGIDDLTSEKSGVADK